MTPAYWTLLKRNVRGSTLIPHPTLRLRLTTLRRGLSTDVYRLNVSSSITLGFPQEHRRLNRGPEPNWYALAHPAVLCFEHAKMKMRSGRKPRASRSGDHFARGNTLTHRNREAVLLEMTIVGKSTVVVPNQNVVVIPVELDTCPALA